ncbi:MAG: hypothetical protein U1F34_03875 [Gammaproteobacteria bacterium]
MNSGTSVRPLTTEEATTSGIDDSASLGGYLNWKVHPQWVLTGYGSAGLTNGTADEEVKG